MDQSRRLGLLARLKGVQGRVAFGDAAVTEVAGAVPASFSSACGDIARLHRIPRGRVEIVGRGRHARLRFSRHLPASARQAIANVWTPPSGPGRGGSRASG